MLFHGSLDAILHHVLEQPGCWDGHHRGVWGLTVGAYIPMNRRMNSSTTPASPSSSRAMTPRSMCSGTPP